MCRQAVGGIFAQLERLGAGLFMHLTHSGGRDPSLTVFFAILVAVPESSPCGSPRPGPLARPPQSRTSARAVTPFVGHPSSVR